MFLLSINPTEMLLLLTLSMWLVDLYLSNRQGMWS